MPNKYKAKVNKYYRNKGIDTWRWTLIDIDNNTLYVLVSLKPIECRRIDNKKLFEWAKRQKPIKIFYDESGITVKVIVNEDIKENIKYL